MELPVDGFLIWKDRLNLLEDVAATRRADRRQNRRDVEHLRHLGERRDVVDDHRGVVTVDVGELRWLVIDEENHAVLRRQKRVETNFSRMSA